MKKCLSLIYILIIFIILIGLTGCTNIEEGSSENSIVSNSDEVELNYNDATTFEKALNSGEKVKGKTVKFDIKEYKPNSALGINCWSGEHLNFISDNELDVKTGDFIVGRIKEEPTKTLGSWKIKYDVIEIQYANQENEVSENIIEEEKIEDIKNGVMANEEKQSENVESNNTNIDNNEATNQITYNYYTTNDNETAKNGNAGKYSYVKRNGSYKVYWIIDFDEGYVYDFTEGNGDDSCEKIKIKSGNLNDGLELSYKNTSNAWAKYIHFKYTNQPHQLIIVDNDYFEYEYSTTSLEETLELMKNKTMWQP